VPDELIQGPVPIAVTAAAGVLSGINGFTGMLGLAPFWADTVIGVFLLAVTWFWLVRMLEGMRANRRARGKATTPSSLVRGTGRIFAITAVVAALSIWTCIGPLRHVSERRWNFCGRVSTTCASRPCLLLFDRKERRVASSCYLPADETGYFDIKPDNWWTYKPASAAVVCGDRISPTYRATEMFRTLCDGSLDGR
jgi:hypothetical protein